MVIGSGELERLADEMYKDRRITGPVYCGVCGYCLRTLPYRYRCPECGGDYNARPLKLTGIFTPHETQIPFREMGASIVCVLCAMVLGYTAFGARDYFRIGFAVVFVVFAFMFGLQAYARLVRCIRAAEISRRIAAEEE